MKKTIIFFLAAIFLLNAISCSVVNKTGDKTNENIEGSDRYKPYKYGIVAGDYIFSDDTGLIMKYNIHDGKASYLCPDPFCTHSDKNCQFADVGENSFASIGNTVYYIIEDESTGSSVLNSFDVNTAETKTVYSCSGRLVSVYAYYYKLLVHYVSSFGLSASGYYFWYDTKTGKIEELKDGIFSEGGSVYDIKDDRIIWYSSDRNNRKSTDLYGNDCKTHDYLYAYGCHYETEENEADGSYSLYAAFDGETEKKLIAENIGPFIFYENKIVYFKYVPLDKRKVVFVYDETHKATDNYGGDVYVMNPDGADNHLLLHTDEYIVGMTSSKNHPQVSGDYFGIIAGYFDEEGYVNMDRLIIANINTGEYVISHE